MNRAVIFDIDDTLYLESEYVSSGFLAVDEHVRQQLGVSGFADTAWRLFQCGVRDRVFNAAIAELSLAPNALDVAELVAVYRTHDPRIELLPDSALALDLLREQDMALGLITDGPPMSQWAKIAALGLESHMDAIVVTGDLGAGMGKPSEAAFRMVQERLGLRGRSLTYVADNPMKDFIAPHDLGWATARIRRVGGLHESLDSDSDVHREHADLRQFLVANHLGDADATFSGDEEHANGNY